MTAVRLRHGAETREVRLETDAAVLEGRCVRFLAHRRDGRLERLSIDGRTHRVATAREGERVFVWCDGAVHVFDRVRGARSSTASETSEELVAPMPGRVRRTFVAEGDRVSAGQALLLLEAMKMEHAIRTPRDGVVRRLLVKEGDLVEAGVELAEIAEARGADG